MTPRLVSSGGLVIGTALGMAATFVPSEPARGLLWGLDGIALIAALLFAIVAARLFLGHALTPLSQPLPYFAYPFLVATLWGSAWERFRGAP